MTYRDKINQILKASNLYEYLGISRTATSNEIEGACKALIPLLFSLDLEAQDERVVYNRINEAKGTLSDPEKRQKYEEILCARDANGYEPPPPYNAVHFFVSPTCGKNKGAPSHSDAPRAQYSGRRI